MPRDSMSDLITPAEAIRRMVAEQVVLPPVDLKRPVWDKDRRELRLGGQRIKRFTRPAPLLELILAAFEEQGWPPEIDDPLPRERGIRAKSRLRETIKRLNLCQEIHIVRFRGGGAGRSVRWQFDGGFSRF